MTEETRDTFGIIGLGLMGSALAARALQAGIAVIGYDRVAERREALAALGGRAAESAREVAERCGRLEFSVMTTELGAGRPQVFLEGTGQSRPAGEHSLDRAHSFPRRRCAVNRRSRAGFTLIELLVVIAIIAILAAVLFPVFAQARAKARAISCLASIKQWGTATFMYTQDYDERFPRFFREMPGFRPTSTYNQTTGFHPGGLYWHEAILPYIKNQQSLLCQQAQGALNPFCLPYGWNWAFVHDTSIAEYPFPAETLVVADGRGRLTAASDRTFCNKNQAAIGSICADCLDEGKYIYGHGLVPPAAAATKPELVKLDANWSVSPRHQGKANVVFMDGHAKAMDAETLNRCNNWWDGDGAGGDCRVGARHPKYSLAYR